MNQLSNYKLNSDYRRVLRYEGVFTDRERRQYTLHILHDGTAPLEQVRLGSKPIVISRESERLDGLIQSRAAVSLLSHSDGLFRHLHTMPEGSVKLVVWRDGTLYWLGTLDPESYEEDYSRKDNYLVELTFSDFGCAKRLRHRYKGKQSLMQWARQFVGAAIAHSQYGLGGDALPLDYDPFVLNVGILGYASSWLSIYGAEDELDAGDYAKESEPILSTGYVSARAFYKDDKESLSIFDSLDGLLRSFGLRLEQRAGQFVFYDAEWLVQQEASPLRVRGNDARFVADEIYSAINIEVDTRLDAAVAKYDFGDWSSIERWGLSSTRDYDSYTYPRLDYPDKDAYSIRAVRLQSGAMHVKTTPLGVGESEEFIAMCFSPVTHKAGVVYTDQRGRLNTRYSPISATFVEEKYLRDDFRRHGAGWQGVFRFNTSSMDGSRLVRRPSFVGMRRWIEASTPDCYMHKMFSPAVPASSREVVARLEIPVNGLSNVGIRLNAKLFVSFQPSLYQKLDKRFTMDAQYLLASGRNAWSYSGNNEEEQKKLEEDKLPDAEIGAIYLSARVRCGEYILVMSVGTYQDVYNGKTLFAPDGNSILNIWNAWSKYYYLWERYSDANKDSVVYLPFGSGESYNFGSWVSLSNKALIGMKYPEGKAVPIFDDTSDDAEGLAIVNYLPSDAEQVSVEILGEVIFGSDMLAAKKSVSIFSFQTLSESQLLDGLVPPHFPTSLLALERGVFRPSYVLLKDLSLALSDTNPDKLDDDRLKKTAIINDRAYEAIDIEPLLTTDHDMPTSSPALVVDRAGRRIIDIRKVNYSDPQHDYASMWYDYNEIQIGRNSSELIATQAFAHYGTRRHQVEGRFQSVDTLALVEYAGHRYMVLNEEADLRACASEYVLAEISPSNYKPSLKMGATEDGGQTFVLN